MLTSNRKFERTSSPSFRSGEAFADGGFDHLNADLKEIRNIFLAIEGVSKSWEVLVCQTIAYVALGNGQDGAHALKTYIVTKTCVELLRI